MDSTSLINDLLNPQKETIKVSCKLGKLLEGLAEDERNALDKSIVQVRSCMDQGKTKVYSSVWLSKVLRKHGYHISTSTVTRHVNKECSCEQPD